jgi:hypothetical protein
MGEKRRRIQKDLMSWEEVRRRSVVDATFSEPVGRREGIADQ